MSFTVRPAFATAIGLGMLAFAPALAQEFTVGSIKIEAPWLRSTPTGAEVAGGYMRIENTGKETDRLVDGSTSVAAKFEIHQMKMSGNVMRMRELNKGLEVKPGERVELKPGSYHIMLLGLKQPLKEGDKVKGTLVFEKAGKVEVEYAVRGMGSQGGGQAGSHGGHGKRR